MLNGTNNVTVVVNELNEAPVLAGIGDVTVDEGSVAGFTAQGSDSDVPAQTLSYSLGAGAPAGASIDGLSGVFSWTTGEMDGGTTNVIEVIVSDDGVPMLNGTNNVTVVVNEVNIAPMLAGIGAQSAQEGVLFTLTVSAEDDDLPAQTLTYSLGVNAPEGASIGSGTGVFTWTPAVGNTTNSVTVVVTDSGIPELSDSETFEIVVSGGLVVTGIVVVDGEVTVTWSAVPGESYQVEYSDAVTGSAWLELGAPVVATGGSASIVDTVVGEGQRYYRVRLL